MFICHCSLFVIIVININTSNDINNNLIFKCFLWTSYQNTIETHTHTKSKWQVYYQTKTPHKTNLQIHHPVEAVV